MALKDLVTLDKRSIAVWRFLTGLIAAGDLIERFVYTNDYYTTDLTPVSLRKPYVIHEYSNEYGFQLSLFSLHTLAVLCVALGYFTKTAHAIAYYMYYSLHYYEHYTFTAQDRYFMSIWFFMFFLPIEEAWSVDSWLGNKTLKSRKYRAPSTLLVLSFVFNCYTASTTFKTGKEWTETYDAAFYALANHSPLPLGVFVFENVPMRVLQLLTAATYFLERYAFLLLFIPYKTYIWRTCLSVSFWLMHLGLCSTLRLGLFFWGPFAHFFVYLPSELWDKLGSNPEVNSSASATSSPIKTPGRKKMKPSTLNTQMTLYKILAQIVALWAFVLMTNQTLTQLELPHIEPDFFSVGFIQICHPVIEHRWSMFAPNPPYSNAWYILLGKLENGQRVELLDNNGLTTWIPNRHFRAIWDQKPANYSNNFVTRRRWKWWTFGFGKNEEGSKRAVAYWCREFNSRLPEGEKLEIITAWRLESKITLEKERLPAQRKQKISWNCKADQFSPARVYPPQVSPSKFQGKNVWRQREAKGEL